MDTKPSTRDLPAPVLQDALGPANECCVICLGDLVELCEAQPCGHKNFDFLCLTTWLQHRTVCPMCKSDVHQVRYELSEDGKQGKVYTVPPSKSNGQAQRGASISAPRPSRARPFEDQAVRRRRLVYRHSLFSLHVGSNRRQPGASRYRELSPQLFATDTELLSRARKWLRRELRVFECIQQDDDPDTPHDSDATSASRPRRVKADFLVEYIVAVLRTMDTQGSAGQAENMIQEFLGRHNTQIFLHELRAWLRSPCQSLREWDRVVQYGSRRGPNAIAPQALQNYDEAYVPRPLHS
ncbi:hypothetical protein G7Z17_g7556 [Cylindrodendrum hubeiense]|uniref:RING-type E3 ubiquitin transferase n=1 Tax=Cylindrodendrum hubeiense TaxID=595255 RepID=A0A9P5HCZ8_9HYPO|nr:hypothetical protein G7Z17_g7556 [Cylindrodendrum hubeiense]